MKRVLIFSLAYMPHVGGAEVSIKELTDRMPDIEFHMVTNRFDSSLPRVEKIGNVLVHRIGITTTHPAMADLRKFPLHLNKGLYQFLAPFKAYFLHRRYRYDAAWAMTAHSCGIPALLFKKLTGVPYVLNLQEGDPPAHVEKKMRLLLPLFTRAFTRADIVQPLSNFLADWARRRGFKGHIEIIPNGVDVARFAEDPMPAALNEIKDELSKKLGDIFLVTSSRLVHKNALDDVIRALPMLPTNVQFIVLGTGPEEAKLKQLASEIKVSNRVRFIGHVTHDRLPMYLKACDIFVRPSRSEGFGASFVEAMAAGLPVIATQEGGLADFLFDEKRNPDMPITGFAVDANAPDQIAAAVQEIIAKPEKVRAVVATAREMVRGKYDWDLIAREMRGKVLARLG